MVERTIPGKPRPASPEVGQNPRGAMRGALMCRFLSHQGTEYTLSGLFSVASADSSEHVSLANGREISSVLLRVSRFLYVH